MKTIVKAIACFLFIIIASAVATSSALANTDGNEIQITDQPDKLIIQFGVQWAGTEFELKTDAGTFPVPVVVDGTGMLKMDLGGSKTYILSCLSSAPETPITEPSPTAPAVLPTLETEPDNIPEPDTGQSKAIPRMQLAVFIIGLLIAGGGLLVMRYIKHRREAYYYDYDDEDYD